MAGRLNRQVALWVGLALVATAGAAAGAVAYRASAGQLLKVRVGNAAGESRLVLELDQAPNVSLDEDPAEPARHLTFQIAHIRIISEGQGAPAGLLRRWRSASFADDARLELDFDREVTVKRRFLLPPDDGIKVYRYVIDFAARDASTPVLAQTSPGHPGQTQSAATVRSAGPSKATLASLQAFAERNRPTARKVIVIDPGHGGKDPGAPGAATQEKSVTLAAAKALRERLLATGRYQVILTRADDTFIPLEQRVQIARRENADLFISLHADSIPDASLHGATVYTLSEKGVDRAARKVMARSDWFSDVDLPGRDPAVNRILLDLTQRETTNQSTGFANLLIGRLAGKVDLLRRSHRDANYAVLLAPDVPAVLLEMGFISNPLDERRLNSDDGRADLVESVADAIDAYFTRQTRIALR